MWEHIRRGDLIRDSDTANEIACLTQSSLCPGQGQDSELFRTVKGENVGALDSTVFILHSSGRETTFLLGLSGEPLPLQDSDTPPLGFLS